VQQPAARLVPVAQFKLRRLLLAANLHAVAAARRKAAALRGQSRSGGVPGMLISGSRLPASAEGRLRSSASV